MERCCMICDYIFDLDAGAPFGKRPKGWVCPLCSADRDNFKKV